MSRFRILDLMFVTAILAVAICLLRDRHEMGMEIRQLQTEARWLQMQATRNHEHWHDLQQEMRERGK